MLRTLDKIRKDISLELEVEEKTNLGQFMTPSSIAQFMASLFVLDSWNSFRLLDPGAGIGSLSTAFLERVSEKQSKIEYIETTHS